MRGGLRAWRDALRRRFSTTLRDAQA